MKAQSIHPVEYALTTGNNNNNDNIVYLSVHTYDSMPTPRCIARYRDFAAVFIKCANPKQTTYHVYDRVDVYSCLVYIQLYNNIYVCVCRSHCSLHQPFPAHRFAQRLCFDMSCRITRFTPVDGGAKGFSFPSYTSPLCT